MSERDGRAFREAWVAGVRRHFPGEPKPGYVAPWEETPEWEREAAAATYAQVREHVAASPGEVGREAKGRVVAALWRRQMVARFGESKPGYTAEWEALPGWQREVDADVYDAVAQG
jgi:hypothetical protein